MNRFRRYDLYPSTKALNQLTVAKDVLNEGAVGGVYVFFDPSGRIPTEEAKLGFLSGRLLFVDRNPCRKIAESPRRSVSPAHGFRNTRPDKDEKIKKPVVEKSPESLSVEEAAKLKEEIEGIGGTGAASKLGELGRYGRETETRESTRRTSSCGKHGGHKDCEKGQTASEETSKSRSRRILESHLREGDRQSGQLQAALEENILSQRKKSNSKEGDIRTSNGAAPAIQPVAPAATPKAWVREQVLVLYQKHNPSKLAEVEKLLAKYAGKEEEMYQKICKKYSVAPLARKGEPSVLNLSEEKGCSVKLPAIAGCPTDDLPPRLKPPIIATTRPTSQGLRRKRIVPALVSNTNKRAVSPPPSPGRAWR